MLNADVLSYIPIRSYDNYITANMELALLREAGIDCHMKDEFTVTIDPLLSPALGGMKLMVTSESVSSAIKILEASDKLYLQSVPCPFCKHPCLERITETTAHRSWIDKMRSRLVNGQEQVERTFYRCSNCSHVFNTLPDGG